MPATTIPMPIRTVSVIVCLLLFALVLVPIHAETRAASTSIGPVVVVISFDGMRGDYPERADTPFFDRLMSEGAYTREMKPVFPSLTFPTHVSQATGVRPGEHGITANAFYDSSTETVHRYPGNSELLEAEPIWTTAQRQGIRTASVDWTLSHAQTGPHATAYFDDAFERGLTSEERLNRLVEIWEDDAGDPPLRLLLGYAASPDTEGHRYGPNSPEILEAVHEVDRLAEDIYDKLLTIWKSHNPAPDDSFYFIITSDHGMTDTKMLIHPEHLTALEDDETVKIVTSGPVGHIHLKRDLDPAFRDELTRRTLERMQSFDYVQGFARSEIPEEWGYRHPDRTGDILLVLDEGYTFSRRPDGIEMPVGEAGGPLGMHGFDPVHSTDMRHFFLLHRYPNPIGSIDLGPQHALQVHPTIADLLGIEPSPDAHWDAIEIPPQTAVPSR